MGRTPSNTADTPLSGRVCVGKLGLREKVDLAERDTDRTRLTHQACKILAYSRDTQPDVPLDEHRDIHHLLNSIRILHTTSIPACVSGYTRARIRKHRPSYTIHAANACIR